MTLTAQSSSRASALTLWAVVSDVTRWPDHLETFTEVKATDTARPVGVGSRFAVRQPGLPPAEYEVTSWEVGWGFTWVASSPGVTTTARHTILARGDGSELRLSVDWAGPLAPLVRLVSGRKAQRLIDLEARTLAEVAQTGE